jgi:hypothetical protein
MGNGADTDDDDQEQAIQRWEGYSDYEVVSKRIGRKVSNAIEAYSVLQGAGAERAQLSDYEYTQARAKILDAAMSLKVEIEREAANELPNSDENIYTPIVDRWTDGGDENAPEGYINEFMAMSISNGGRVPGWVFTFVEDIRRAAWELGYLQAGRVNETKDGDMDPDVKSMFEGVDFG